MKNFILSGLIVIGALAGVGFSPSVIPSPVSRPYEVTVSGKQEAAPGELVVLIPQGVEDARTVWNLNYPEDFEQWQEENGKLFIAMPKGKVCFSLFVVPNDESKPIKNIRYVIASGLDGGKDEKEEKEEKAPTGKIGKSDYLVLIEQSGERSIELAGLIQSKFWQVELLGLGHNRPLIYDADTEQGRGFIEEAKNHGENVSVPFFAVMDKDGRYLKSFPVTDLNSLKGLFE